MLRFSVWWQILDQWISYNRSTNVYPELLLGYRCIDECPDDLQQLVFWRPKLWHWVVRSRLFRVLERLSLFGTMVCDVWTWTGVARWRSAFHVKHQTLSSDDHNYRNICNRSKYFLWESFSQFHIIIVHNSFDLTLQELHNSLSVNFASWLATGGTWAAIHKNNDVQQFLQC